MTTSYFPAFDGLANGVANWICAHLGFKVEGRDIGSGNKDSVLALKLDLLAAVEEECHVGILGGLGNAKLGTSRL